MILPEGITAFIPAYHLSDHCDHWQPLLAAYSARLEAARGGQETVRAVVVGRDKGKLLVWFYGLLHFSSDLFVVLLM